MAIAISSIDDLCEHPQGDLLGPNHGAKPELLNALRLTCWRRDGPGLIIWTGWTQPESVVPRMSNNMVGPSSSGAATNAVLADDKTGPPPGSADGSKKKAGATQEVLDDRFDKQLK
eukprot:gene13521-19386_t